jgi:hypothetical protein
MRFGLASLERFASPVNCLSFTLLCLGEHREQNDPAAWCDPVGDSLGAAVEEEPQLPEFAVQLLGVRFVEKRSEFGQPRDMKLDSALLFLGEPLIPVPYFGFEFNLTSGHSAHAI